MWLIFKIIIPCYTRDSKTSRRKIINSSSEHPGQLDATKVINFAPLISAVFAFDPG